MPHQHEAGAVGAIYTAAATQHVVHQTPIHAGGHIAPAADGVQVAPGDHECAAGEGARPPSLATPAMAMQGAIGGRQIDELHALADEARAGVGMGKGEIPNVLRAVAVVIVHLRHQRATRRLDGGVQHGAQRCACRCRDERGGNGEAGEAPLDAGEGGSVAMGREHQLQARPSLAFHGGQRLRQQCRATGGKHDGHRRQVGAIAGPRGVSAQCRAAHGDAVQLPRRGIEGARVRCHERVELGAEQGAEARRVVSYMHHHAGRGQTRQFAGAGHDIVVERLHILHMVEAAQTVRIGPATRVLRADARHQVRRPQSAHFGAGVAGPVDGVAHREVESGCGVQRTRAPTLHTPGVKRGLRVPPRELGSQQPLHRPALVGRQEGQPFEGGASRWANAFAPREPAPHGTKASHPAPR